MTQRLSFCHTSFIPEATETVKLVLQDNIVYKVKVMRNEHMEVLIRQVRREDFEMEIEKVVQSVLNYARQDKNRENPENLSIVGSFAVYKVQSLPWKLSKMIRFKNGSMVHMPSKLQYILCIENNRHKGILEEPKDSTILKHENFTENANIESAAAKSLADRILKERNCVKENQFNFSLNSAASKICNSREQKTSRVRKCAKSDSIENYTILHDGSSTHNLAKAVSKVMPKSGARKITLRNRKSRFQYRGVMEADSFSDSDSLKASNSSPMYEQNASFSPTLIVDEEETFKESNKDDMVSSDQKNRHLVFEEKRLENLKSSFMPQNKMTEDSHSAESESLWSKILKSFRFR